MRIGAVLYVDDNIPDDDLTFAGARLDEDLPGRLSGIQAVTEIFFSVPAAYSGRLDSGRSVLRRGEKDDISFWRALFKETGVDHAVKIFCDSPFLDAGIIADMIDTHVKYLAEFTYSDNLPPGFSCEIFSKELLSSIPESDDKMLPLSEVVRSNINRFDVELYYREPDIRDKRLSFRSGDPREKKIMENLSADAGGVPPYSRIRDLIYDNPGSLYTGPSYVELELSGRCDLDCVFCYRKTLREEHGDMDVEIFRGALAGIKSFGLPCSLCFGGSGEPLMHGSFYELCDLALKEDWLNTLVIETNGIYADGNFRTYIGAVNDRRIKIIFNVNGMDDSSYQSIHGSGRFQTVLQNILALRDSMPAGNSIYLQIMKINETEVFLDNYYTFWEKHKIPIILQKQNTFLSRIKDRRYSDLSPLERTPCWHLQRDMYIAADGRAGFCKQDVDGDFSKGDLKTETLAAVWERSKKHFLNNYYDKFPSSPDCRACDEWYTFNL